MTRKASTTTDRCLSDTAASALPEALTSLRRLPAPLRIAVRRFQLPIAFKLIQFRSTLDDALMAPIRGCFFFAKQSQLMHDQQHFTGSLEQTWTTFFWSSALVSVP